MSSANFSNIPPKFTPVFSSENVTQSFKEVAESEGKKYIKIDSKGLTVRVVENKTMASTAEAINEFINNWLINNRAQAPLQDLKDLQIFIEYHIKNLTKEGQEPLNFIKSILFDNKALAEVQLIRSELKNAITARIMNEQQNKEMQTARKTAKDIEFESPKFRYGHSEMQALKSFIDVTHQKGKIYLYVDPDTKELRTTENEKIAISEEKIEQFINKFLSARKYSSTDMKIVDSYLQHVTTEHQLSYETMERFQELQKTVKGLLGNVITKEEKITAIQTQAGKLLDSKFSAESIVVFLKSHWLTKINESEDSNPKRAIELVSQNCAEVFEEAQKMIKNKAKQSLTKIFCNGLKRN